MPQLISCAYEHDTSQKTVVEQLSTWKLMNYELLMKNIQKPTHVIEFTEP